MREQREDHNHTKDHTNKCKHCIAIFGRQVDEKDKIKKKRR